MSFWDRLGQKCNLLNSNHSYLKFLWQSDCCWISRSSTLPKLDIQIIVNLSKLKDPFLFLQTNARFCEESGFSYCDRCDEIKSDDEVLGNVIFDNPELSFSIILIFTTDQMEVIINENIDLLQLGMMMSNEYLTQQGTGTTEAVNAYTKNMFAITTFPDTWNAVKYEFDKVLALEEEGITFNFQRWESVFELIPKDETFLQEIVKWNTKMKLHPQTSVKMILLTMDPEENETMDNLYWIAYPSDFRYIWRISWATLQAEQNYDYQFVQSREHELYDDTPLSELTKETLFEEKFLSGRLPSTCVDIMNVEMETKLESFIELDRNHIVFLFPLSNNQLSAACYKRSDLSECKIFYPCEENKMQTTDVATSYFRLDVREFPIYITDDNYFYLLQTSTQFFIVNETPNRLGFTISSDVYNGIDDFMSADHCQSGSSKTVSVIFPINYQSLQDAVFHVEGPRKKTKKTVV